MAGGSSPVSASLWCGRCAQIAHQPRHCELSYKERSSSPNIVFVSLYSFVELVRINEPKLKSVIFFSYLFCVRRECVRFAIEQAGRVRRGGGTGNARVDKCAPAFLAFFTFHHVLVERDECRVRRSRKLGKVAHDVLEYLIVIPATCLGRRATNKCTRVSIPRMRFIDHSHEKKSEVRCAHLVSFNERGGIFSTRFQ